MERFIITCIRDTLYIVEDSLTGRIREVTHDLEDANVAATILNAGLVYTGDPITVA